MYEDRVRPAELSENRADNAELLAEQEKQRADKAEKELAELKARYGEK